MTYYSDNFKHPLQRIAEALERIADELSAYRAEYHKEKSHVNAAARDADTQPNILKHWKAV